MRLGRVNMGKLGKHYGVHYLGPSGLCIAEGQVYHYPNLLDNGVAVNLDQWRDAT